MIGAAMFSALTPHFYQQAAGFALDLGLKALTLCAAALVLDCVLRRRVLARSTTLHACLLGLLLLPAATTMLPQLKLNVVAEKGSAGLSPFTSRKDAVSQSETRQNANIAQAEASFAESPVQAGPAAPRFASQRTQAAAPAVRAFNWRAVVLLSYAAVALAALFRLSRSLVAVARLRRSGAPLVEPAWQERLAHWQARLGRARPIELLSSDRVDVPVVVGWRRPVILTPEHLATADRKTIDAILLHELAHVRRADYAWNLLLRLMQAIYWPNPLVWLVGGSLSRVREQACDEVCIHWLGGAEDYRATLVELAGSLLRRPLAALGMAMAGSSRLQRRLEQLGKNRGRAECQSRWTWRFATFAVVISIAGALGALSITNRAAAEPTKEQAQPSEKPIPSQASKEGASGGPAEEPVEPIKVHVEKVRREDFVVQTSQPGTLKSSRSTELHARVAGLIVARHVNVGNLVTAGQVLADIDAPELDADLDQAKALAEQAPLAIEQAQGKLDEASAGLEGAQANLEKADAELQQSMSHWKLAETHHKRLLNAAGSVPRQEIDEKHSQLETAKGAINAAKARLTSAKAEVKQAEAAVGGARAGLRIVKLRLTAAQQALKRVEQRAAYRQIMAPADGVVMRQAAEPGSFAKLGGEPLFVISGTSVVTMQTQIPERDALRVAAGQHARVWLDAEPNGKPHDAKVSRIGYVIDPKTRTMLVEIDLPNSDGRLRPGMRGEATIDLETLAGALTLGKMSLVWDPIDCRYNCFRIVDGRAVKTAVVPGASNDTRREISSGVKEGDVVIARLENGLEDGAPVKIVNDE